MNPLRIPRFKFGIFAIACAIALLTFARPAAADDDPALFSNAASGTPNWWASESDTVTDPWTGFTTVEYVFSSTYIGTGANLKTGIADFDSSSNAVEAIVDFENVGGNAVAFVYTATSTDGGNGSGLPTSFSGGGTPVEEINNCTGLAGSSCGYYATSSGVIGWDSNEAANNYTGMFVVFDGIQSGQKTLAVQAAEPGTLSSLAIGFFAVGLCCWIQRKRKVQVLAEAA